LLYQAQLNDSTAVSGENKGRVSVDTGSARLQYIVNGELDLEMADWAIDTLNWPQWAGAAFTLVSAAAYRAEQKFTYSRRLTPVHVSCCSYQYWYIYGSYTVDTVVVGADHHWGYNDLWILTHEYGHAYSAIALRNPFIFGCHGCPGPPPELNETFANFFVAYIGGQNVWGYPQTAYGPGPALDDWNFERDTMRVAFDTTPESDPARGEWPGVAFLLDLADMAADSNAWENTVGDGAGVDDETINWGPKYIADLIYGNLGGSTAKCVVTWPAQQGGVHYGVQNLQDFLICAEHSTTQRSDVPAYWQSTWWNVTPTYTETVSEPAGWNSTKIRQLWKFDMYNIGSLP
jgi:hypothetical protein